VGVTDRGTAPAIVATGLTKRYGDVTAVEDLSFEVRAGAVTGFLGPNGAGKTTTLRMVLGLARPTAGSASILGRPFTELPEPARSVGANLEICGMHPGRSGRNHLRALADFAGLPASRVDEVLALVEMTDAADRRAGGYSTGMRQRLGLAATLLGDPEVLVLDEPANGLDPAGIVDLRRLLRGLAEDGITIFVSSHLLSEVELVASHVGVLHEGRLRFQGHLAELRARVHPRLHLRCEPALRAVELLTRAGESPKLALDGSLILDLHRREAAEINRLLVEHGVEVSQLRHEQPSLESMFFDLTIASELEQAA